MKRREFQQNEFYRLKAKELINRLMQVRVLIKRHNLSEGVIGEGIVKDFLKNICPQKIGICQGFVAYKGHLSRQCDVILYDQINYSALYSFGDLHIIPSEAVIAVVEVKVSINKKTFNDVLVAFKLLYSMGVNNTYLFLFKGKKGQTFQGYFFSQYVLSDSNRLRYEPLYDKGDYEELPKAIISLDPDCYLAKDYVQYSQNDYFGYIAYGIKDNANKDVVSIQLFANSISRDIFNHETHSNETHSNETFTFESELDNDHNDNLANIEIKAGIPICLL